MSHDGMDRREFLVRTGKVAAGLAVAGGLGYALHDPSGPDPGRNRGALLSYPDFSLADDGPSLSIVTGAERKATLARAITALGGIERFVKPGDRVLLKVNAGFSRPPEIGATTHPDVVRTLATLCQKAGAEVLVTDHPVSDPIGTFEVSGIGAAAREAGAGLVLPLDDQFAPVSLKGGELIRDWPMLIGPFDGVTKLIGVATVKSHSASGATMIMKNWYGLLGGQRIVFHQHIQKIIAELATLVRPTLCVLDGTTTMMNNGPTGGSLSDLAATNTMIVGTDQVAVDVVGSSLLRKQVADLPYLKMAEAAGVGSTDVESLRPRRDHVEG